MAVSNATDVAKGAASAVMTSEGLGGVVALVEVGRKIHGRIVTWYVHMCIYVSLYMFSFFTQGDQQDCENVPNRGVRGAHVLDYGQVRSHHIRHGVFNAWLCVECVCFDVDIRCCCCSSSISSRFHSQPTMSAQVTFLRSGKC